MSKKEMFRIAIERIEILHDLSLRDMKAEGKESQRYLEIMEGIAKRADITLPAGIKRTYCKKCRTPYSSSTRIRMKKGRIVLVTCGECGDRRRLTY